MTDDNEQHPYVEQHQMDTNGFTGHDELLKVAEDRFHKAAIAYCAHMTSDEHDNCEEDECVYWCGLIDSYHVLMTT